MQAVSADSVTVVYTGDECLFALVDLASSASPDFTSTFSLSFPLVLRQVASSAAPLSTRLSLFNRDALAENFASTSHTCPLCFSPSRGSVCIRIESCGCVFDKACLRDYWSLLIREGLVRSVACPSTECVEARAKWEKQLAASGEKKIFEREDEKPGRTTAEEVESLVGEEGRKRWEWLKEKVRMESGAFCLFSLYVLSMMVSGSRTYRPEHHLLPSRLVSGGGTEAVGGRGEVACLPSLRKSTRQRFQFSHASESGLDGPERR